MEQKKQTIDDYLNERIRDWLRRWPDDEKGTDFSKGLKSMMDMVMDQMIDLNRELLTTEDEIRVLRKKNHESEKKNDLNKNQQPVEVPRAKRKASKRKGVTKQ